MGVKWKTTINKLPEIMARAESLQGKAVEVGCTGENAWL